ncbi:hypothetical protein Golob_021544 [Gossypium lobatum]|uniref:Uncharacterized protein n=1 Tax=Gossypium lobatum TaxID=34289 RepID=A0A7J8LDZ7_9ROSI|nr:hypothetical protein [Gossypium lobatum]
MESLLALTPHVAPKGVPPPGHTEERDEDEDEDGAQGKDEYEEYEESEPPL